MYRNLPYFCPQDDLNPDTFRLSDVVGLDTAYYVIEGCKKELSIGYMLQSITLPLFIHFLMEHKWYGSKVNRGFYVAMKEKDANGKKIIHALDLKTLEYKQDTKNEFTSLQMKQIDDLPKNDEKRIIKMQ